MTAPVNLLEEIHSLFAEQIKIEILEYRKEGMPIPAADKAVYAKFLRDNSIFCVPKSEEDLTDLRNALMSTDRNAAIAKLKSEISSSIKGDSSLIN